MNNVNAFEKSVSITRPANTTQYAVGDLVNASGETTLIEVDVPNATRNDHIIVEEVVLLSSYGGATLKLAPRLELYNASTITGSTLTDNTAQNPTYAQSASKLLASINSDEWNQSYDQGASANAYALHANELNRRVKLASGKFYLAIIANNTYTPESGEQFQVTFKGRVLS